MRGKVNSPPPHNLPDGITPAYAGKSEYRSIRKFIPKDHPRLCGEKEHQSTLTRFSQGSPPPMRGKGSGIMRYRYDTGITPAYAGKSHLCRQAVSVLQDHPRLCGEKCSNENRRRIMIGSPPPMRGKVHGSPACTCGTGITPAYAGKRYFMEQSCFCYKDHPRLCGEKRIHK